MKISTKHLNYGAIQDSIKWLDENVSPRKYWLHNQRGGQGWHYYSQGEGFIEIEDEKLAVMFLLKFGSK